MKLGARGDEVIRLQNRLSLPTTGVFDELTAAGVKNIQLKSGMAPSGEVDSATHEILFEADINLSTDHSEIVTDLFESYHLPDGEFKEIVTEKHYIFIHHTSGWNDPYKQIDIWARDKRGQIGTAYVIGGTNATTGDKTYDGRVLQAFDEKYYAWHLGSVDAYMHKHSIGIELCNFGYLTKKGNSFYTYTGALVKSSEVVDLGYSFRGYRYWHKYSKEQIKSLVKLVAYLGKKHDIDLRKGLISWIGQLGPSEAFDYNDEAKHGEIKGLLSHTNVRKDKTDVSPQEDLVNALLNI